MNYGEVVRFLAMPFLRFSHFLLLEPPADAKVRTTRFGEKIGGKNGFTSPSSRLSVWGISLAGCKQPWVFLKPHSLRLPSFPPPFCCPNFLPHHVHIFAEERAVP